MKPLHLAAMAPFLMTLACNGPEKQSQLLVPPTTLIMGGVQPTTPAGAVDLVSRPLPRIAAGTVIGNGPPRGWSNLVLIATPGLGAGDIKDAPQTALRYASMFKFTLLANVSKQDNAYYLDVVGRGFAVNFKGGDSIVESNNTFGADLGLFGRRILEENEKILDNDLRQVARTRTLTIFDAQATMLAGNEHRKMVIRHAILVSPETGQLAALVWLLSKDQAGAYAPAEQAMQLLPPNMHEQRLLSVKKDKFFLGMPSPDAFALMRIPQGRPVAYTPELRRLAALQQWNAQAVVDLETQLRAAVRGVLGR